jgi:hypothetical protein
MNERTVITQSLPLSLTQAAASARLVELRRQAEHDQLVRQVARPHGRTWPSTVVRALRESLLGADARSATFANGTTRADAPNARPATPYADRGPGICCA